MSNCHDLILDNETITCSVTVLKNLVKLSVGARNFTKYVIKMPLNQSPSPCLYSPAGRRHRVGVIRVLLTGATWSHTHVLQCT